MHIKPHHIIMLACLAITAALVFLFVRKENFGIVYYGKYSWNDNGYGLPMNQSNWSRGEFSSPFIYQNQGLYRPPTETLFNYNN